MDYRPLCYFAHEVLPISLLISLPSPPLSLRTFCFSPELDLFRGELRRWQLRLLKKKEGRHPTCCESRPSQTPPAHPHSLIHQMQHSAWSFHPSLRPLPHALRSWFELSLVSHLFFPSMQSRSPRRLYQDWSATPTLARTEARSFPF